MLSRHSADQDTCSSTWPATRIALPFPTTASSPLANGEVTFRWKDYAHGNKKRKMKVTSEEFLRRFLLHVLPRGFVRIRHFSFLAPPRRRESIAVCRQVLAQAPFPRPPVLEATAPSPSTWPSPCCGDPMIILEKLTAQQIHLSSAEWTSMNTSHRRSLRVPALSRSRHHRSGRMRMLRNLTIRGWCVVMWSPACTGRAISRSLMP